MNIYDIIKRAVPPVAEAEAEKIPWNEPEFSRRMLEAHLSQEHDWASRRQEFIDQQVAWLASRLKDRSRILDLACGPGFYTQALAGLGHDCVGVDFSPASIEYARRRAGEAGLAIEYIQKDIRAFSAAPQSFDCVIFVFGEFNVFKRADAEAIMAECGRLLKPGGLLLLEGHTFEAVRETGLAPASWWTAGTEGGVLSGRPHLCLQENFWDREAAVATTRYYVLDAESNQITPFASAMTAYSFSAYETLLREAGFGRLAVLKPEQWPVGKPFEGLMTAIAAYRE